MTAGRPPIIVVWLLNLMSEEHGSVIGDMTEEYHERVAASGKPWAVIIVWLQVMRLLPVLLTQNLYWSVIMLKNYLKIATRNLIKYKSFSLINISGLIIGLACCILMFLFVQDELSYDRFHDKAGRIYRVNGTSMNPEGDFYRTILPAPAAPTLIKTYGEIEAVVRTLRVRPTLMRVDNQANYESGIYFADPTFFDIFSFEIAQGNPALKLAEPGTIFISEKMSRKYFGTANPVGQTFNFDNTVDLTVVGILKDPPRNTRFRIDFLGSLMTPGIARQGWLNAWDSSTTETFVLLRQDMEPAALEAKFPDFVQTYLGGSLDEGETYRLSLQALVDIRLYPHRAPQEVWSNSNLKYVYYFPMLSILILLIACFNYMNMATARAMDRAREIGVRKVLGSRRSQLIRQFLGESLAVTFLALLGALLVAKLTLPQFAELSGKSIGSLGSESPLTLLGLVGIWLGVGLMAGGYPAFFLSAFRPVVVIKGGEPSQSRTSPLRTGLVVSQFIMAITLTISTLVVGKQIQFMQTKDLGFNKDQVVVIPIRDAGVREDRNALKSELRRIPGVSHVTFSSGVPNDIGFSSTAKWQGQAKEERLEFNHVMVDYDFLAAYELEIVSGRPFSPDFATDATAAYILNETAAERLGWQNPLGRKLTIWGREGVVIGIVKNFNYEALSEPVGPIAFHFGQQLYSRISLKIGTEGIPHTLASLKAVMQEFVPNYPFEYTFLDETFAALYRSEERFGEVVRLGMVLSLFLACLGLLGLTSFIVERRSKEISIRKVLGASAPSIMMLLTRGFAKLVAFAFVIAVPISYFAMDHWLDNFAFRIKIGWDLYLVAGCGAIFVALLTICLRSAQAAMAKPIEKLTYE